MNKLYVIGNGFDRHHSLPTLYGNFHEYILQNNDELEDIFDEYFQFKTDRNQFWSQVERDFSTFDYRSFFTKNCDIDIMDDGFRRRDTDILYDELEMESEELVAKITQGFQDWIGAIDITAASVLLDLDDTAQFISFNYTQTLEQVYKIPKSQVFHIHGEIQDGYGDLVIGHNKLLRQESEQDENGDSNRTVFSDSEAVARLPFYALRKPVSQLIKQSKNLFDSTKGISNIYVLGHSLNKIDLPYFKRLAKMSPDACWHVSYYDQKEKKSHAAVLNRLKIMPSSVRLFQL